MDLKRLLLDRCSGFHSLPNIVICGRSNIMLSDAFVASLLIFSISPFFGFVLFRFFFFFFFDFCDGGTVVGLRSKSIQLKTNVDYIFGSGVIAKLLSKIYDHKPNNRWKLHIDFNKDLKTCFIKQVWIMANECVVSAEIVSRTYLLLLNS